MPTNRKSRLDFGAGFAGQTGWRTLRKVNLIFGFVLLFTFFGTGLYMKSIFKPEHLSELTVRMEIRANHVYILFIALLNLFAFRAYSVSAGKFVVLLNTVSRALLLAAGCFAMAGFLWEHSGTLTGRSYTLLCAVASLSAALLCVGGHWLERLQLGGKTTAE